jgi:hypothetical protein
VGYQEEWDSTTWNMGFVFRWSEFYEAWLDCGIVLTVKPGQTLAEAFEVRMDEPMWKQYSIFFNVDKS